MSSESKKPVILLTNDDGIDSEGLRLLRQSLENIAELYVCAPLSERSGASHGINLKKEMLLETRETDGRIWGYALDSTPSDCVKLALSYLQLPRPDLVVSGINCGNNVGNSIYYSGTVGGAREAVMYGIPAIAVSMSFTSEHPPDFAASVAFTPWIVLQTLETKLPDYAMLNVNIPSVPVEEIQGIAITRQGYSSYIDQFEKSAGASGELFCKNIGSRFLNDTGLHKTDAQALVANQISISPIQLDSTHYGLLEQLESWLQKPEFKKSVS